MSAGLAALAAFNLVCSGTTTSGTLVPGKFGLDKEEKGVFEQTYRVDLDEGRWCSGECKETKPLYKVSATTIWFTLEDPPDELTDTMTFVNRETGELTDRIRVYGYTYLRMGQCVRAPFSGFPVLRF